MRPAGVGLLLLAAPLTAQSQGSALAARAAFPAGDLRGVAAIVSRHGLIAGGVSAKYARQQIGDYAVDAWAGDVGVAVAIFDIFALGASVQNLGGHYGDGGGARMPR